MKLIGQSIAILFATSIVFGVVNTQLADYLSYIVALIIIAGLTLMLIKKNKNLAEATTSSSLFVFIITTGLLLIIFLTGGLDSSLFFLTYFLLFGITFMFEPATVFVFLIGLIILFANLILKDDVFLNAIRIGSLVLLSPLAFFFGNEYKKKESLEDEVEEKSEEIIQAADELLHQDAKKFNPKDVDKIDQIIEKANALKEKVENS